MTRETKIGMIVAGSFLSLVGVVVGTKLYKRDLPENKTPEAVVSSTEPGKKDTPQPGTVVPNGSTPPNNIALAKFDTQGSVPPLLPPPGPPSSEISLPPPTGPIGPPPGADPVAAALLAAKEKEKHLHDNADHPIPSIGNPPGIPAPTIDTGRNGIADFGKPAVNGIASVPPPIDRNGFPVPPLARPADPVRPPAVMVAQGSNSKPTPPPAGIELPPISGPPTASPSSPTSPPPPIAPTNSSTPPVPPIGGLPPVPPNATPNATPTGPPPAPIAGPPTVAPPRSGPDAIVPPPSVPNNSTPVPPPAPIAKDPIPSPPPFNPGPSTPPPPAPITTVPRPPAPISSVPPLAPPTPPAVVVGDEQRYVVKPADSYRSISQQAYGDDRYAAALQEYNRSRLGAAAPATLQPGAEIVIPTASSLKNSRFGVLIAATPTPPPAPPAPPSPPPLTTSPAALAPIATIRTVPTVPPAPPFPSPTPPPPPPPPLVNRDPVTIGPVSSPSAQPATPTAPLPAGATYRIPAGGKLIATVAQEQLGSPLRWIDIYRLNSNLDPSRPIPEGIEIRLPPR